MLVSLVFGGLQAILPDTFQCYYVQLLDGRELLLKVHRLSLANKLALQHFGVCCRHFGSSS